MLVLQATEEGVKHGHTRELSMILKDNFMINRFLEAIGAARDKTYRVFKKAAAE